ncbi:hypothetical protein GDO81_024116 [Engystomops pustulosus]|uniref:Uncharacterized protein n=1 Tax=Engystomops pustulosus TaxID=76066 RepID=A0AAV6ZHN2_ENGPU|nr:hypothetical protein GDO81_024116 [Engystomops pustulosus]
MDMYLYLCLLQELQPFPVLCISTQLPVSHSFSASIMAASSGFFFSHSVSQTQGEGQQDEPLSPAIYQCTDM